MNVYGKGTTAVVSLAAAGQVASGGDIYTRDPMTRTAIVVVHHRPDQRVGCAAATTSSRRAPAFTAHRFAHSTSNLRHTLVAAGLARAGAAKPGPAR